jgi:ligand-binding SRPBCC domain-containing protein
MGSSRNPRPFVSVFERSTWLDAPIEAVFAFHENPRNLEQISPPSLRVERIDADAKARVGGRFHIVARQFGLPIDWLGEWLAVEPPTRLVDGARRAPFAVFDHEHVFATEGAGTRMTDRVTFALLGPRWGILGHAANWFAARWVLAPMFRRRHETTRRWFASGGGNATRQP